MADDKFITAELEKLTPLIGNDYILSAQNGAELISYPSPMSFEIFKKLNSFDGSLGLAYRELNLPIQPFNSDKYCIYFLGRIFLNLREEERFVHDFIGYQYKLTDDQAVLCPKKKNLSDSLRAIKYSYRQAQIVTNTSETLWSFENTSQKLSDILPMSITLMADNPVELFKKELNLFIKEYSSIFKAAIIEQIIYQLAIQKYGIQKTLSYLSRLKYSQSNQDKYLESSFELENCFNKVSSLEKFIDCYGQRAFDDFEISTPRFREIKNQLAKITVNNAYKPQPTPPLDTKIPDNIRKLQTFIATKNNLRLHILNRYYRLRQLLVYLDREYKLNNNIFYLSIDELNCLDSIKPSELANKKEEIGKLKNVPLPTIITPNMRKTTHSQEKIKATSVSTGKTMGQLIKIDTPYDNLEYGKIVVIPNANPEYTHLYNKAKGIIFLKGSALSHGAIIARELRIPAVVFRNQDTLNRILASEVILDADNGCLETIH